MDPGNAQRGITESNYYVTNDTWNAGRYSDLSQALYVCNYNSWYAIAAMNNDTGDGAVKTSPNVQETWYPTPTKLSNWESITSQFSDVPPGTGSNYGIWEFEYDVWLNGLADSNSTEVMIWTYNNGQAPSGSPTGSFTDGGHTYVVYRSPPPNQYIAFVALNDSLSGHINLLHFFKYVISKDWIPSSSTLYQICNGVELVSTNSKPEKFTVNNFSVNMKAHLLGTSPAARRPRCPAGGFCSARNRPPAGRLAPDRASESPSGRRCPPTEPGRATRAPGPWRADRPPSWRLALVQRPTPGRHVPSV